MTIKRKNIGKIGENIAKKFLVKQKFIILEMNYVNNIGEIDIIVRKGDTIHFVEVKTFSRETLYLDGNYVIHETNYLNPEDNITKAKIDQLERVVSSYCFEKGIEDQQIQIDAVAVELFKLNRGYKVKVKYFENINY